MSQLHCYEFNGFGSYSEYHNWDTGLFSSLEKNPISNASTVENYSSFGVTQPLEKGLFYDIITYGGSRNVHGVVIASTKTEAIQMLKDFDNSFKVVEYEL